MNIGEVFQFPAVHTQIVFGFGAADQLPAKVRRFNSDKVLIVTDQGIVRAGILEKIAGILKKGGIEVSVYDEIPQDSSTFRIEQATALLKRAGAGVVVGLGGGSSMDAAKAVAVLATNTGPIQAFAGLDKVPISPLPMIAVPTTSGTGSEVSYWSVMTDDEKNMKISVGGEAIFPKVAVCDPELTLALPPYITATTGMDALTHAIESYVNKSYQPISSALTYRAIELIGSSLARAAADGQDREARYGMMLGSTLAGLGMNPTRLGIVHALAMPLGSWEIKIAHGAANAVLLPHAMEFNLEAAPERYAEVARALGERKEGLTAQALAERSVEIVRKLSAETGIPAGLGVLGLKMDRIADVCREAMKSGNIAVNPRETAQRDLEALCLKAL